MLQTKQNHRITRRYRNEEIHQPDVGPVHRAGLFRSVRPGFHRHHREEDRKDQEKGQEDQKERDHRDANKAELTSFFHKGRARISPWPGGEGGRGRHRLPRGRRRAREARPRSKYYGSGLVGGYGADFRKRSEEHTSEL